MSEYSRLIKSEIEMKEENPDSLKLTALQKDILTLLKAQSLHGVQLMD
jgi:hypothetical protein